MKIERQRRREFTIVVRRCGAGTADLVHKEDTKILILGFLYHQLYFRVFLLPPLYGLIYFLPSRYGPKI